MYLVTSGGRDLSECGRDSVFLATLVDLPTQLHSASGKFLTGHVVEQLDTNGRWRSPFLEAAGRATEKMRPKIEARQFQVGLMGQGL